MIDFSEENLFFLEKGFNGLFRLLSLGNVGDEGIMP
jgi:hypothetical protein